jgi:hypothetical protein
MDIALRNCLAFSPPTGLSRRKQDTIKAFSCVLMLATTQVIRRDFCRDKCASNGLTIKA